MHTVTDTGPDTDISLPISPQIEVFAKEAIRRVYQQEQGYIILGIL